MSAKRNPYYYYKRKPHQLLSDELLPKAVEDYLADRSKGLRDVAARHHMSVTKLRRGIEEHQGGQHRQPAGFRQLLSPEQEGEIAAIIKLMAKHGFGYSQLEIRQTVADYCAIFEFKRLNSKTGELVPISFTAEGGLPSENWITHFCSRNGIKRKNPVHISLSRDWATKNVFVIKPFYRLMEEKVAELTSEMTRHKIPLEDLPYHLWNLDETGYSLDAKSRMVYAGTSDRAKLVRHGEGRTQYSVLTCVNAAGESQPPPFIFKGSYKTAGLDAFDVEMEERSGWMTSRVFAAWFRRFCQKVTLRPLLLLLDGHVSHIQSEIIELAMERDSRELSIKIIKLPPHATDVLQPLDVGVFGLAKRYWNENLTQFRKDNNVVAQLSKVQFCSLVTDTWNKIRPDVIVKSFEKSGVYPVNFDKYPKYRLDPRLLRKAEHVESAGRQLSELSEDEYKRLVLEPASPAKSPRKPSTPQNTLSPHREAAPATTVTPCNLMSSFDIPAKPQQSPVAIGPPPSRDRMWRLEWKLTWMPTWVADEPNTSNTPASSRLLSPEERMERFHSKILDRQLPSNVPPRKTAEEITTPEFLEKRKATEARSRARQRPKAAAKLKPLAPSCHPSTSSVSTVPRKRRLANSSSESSTDGKDLPASKLPFQRDDDETSLSSPTDGQVQRAKFRCERRKILGVVKKAIKSLGTRPTQAPLPQYPCEVFYAVYYEERPYIGKIIDFEAGHKNEVAMSFLHRDQHHTDSSNVYFSWPSDSDNEIVNKNRFLDGPVVIVAKSSTDCRGSDRGKHIYCITSGNYQKLLDLNSRYRNFICHPSPHPSEADDSDSDSQMPATSANA